MKNVRIILILSFSGLAIAFGAMLYSLLWGPDRVPLAGRSIGELLESGELAPLFIMPVVLGITLFSMRPIFRIFFPDEIRDGLNAGARILKVWDTGTTINDDPQIGLLMEITPAVGNPFQAESKTIVSRLQVALVQPGIAAEVRYDPNNTKRVRVLSLDIREKASGTASRLEELENLRDRRLITEEEYRRKREEILKAL